MASASATWVPAKEGDTPGQMDPQVWVVAAGRTGIPYHAPDYTRQATRCGRWYGLDGLDEHGEALRGELLTLTRAIAQYDARPCAICYERGEDECG
jgi:hypothetical protein